MDVKDLKKLLDAVAGADVSEFSLETGDYKLSLKRASEHDDGDRLPAMGGVAVTSPPPLTPEMATTAPPVVPESLEEPASNFFEVKAPIVGTFYAAPAPDAAPYVRVGDRVEPGAVLCIIEAMKLMNEIEAETSGKVVEIMVHNEEPVEYGQVLFRIDPG